MVIQTCGSAGTVDNECLTSLGIRAKREVDITVTGTGTDVLKFKMPTVCDALDDEIS